MLVGTVREKRQRCEETGYPNQEREERPQNMNENIVSSLLEPKDIRGVQREFCMLMVHSFFSPDSITFIFTCFNSIP